MLGIYDFHLWEEEKQDITVKWFKTLLQRLRNRGEKFHQPKRFFTRIDQAENRLKEMRVLDEVEVVFAIPRTDGSSWSNEVRISFGLKDNRNQFKGEMERAKKERRAWRALRFDTYVKLRPHINGSKPEDAVVFASMLANIASFAVETRHDMEILIQRIGNFPEDETKVKADNELRARRMFIEQELQGLGERLEMFILGLLDEEFLQPEGVITTMSHRFEGKERKLLNKIPATIMSVSHKRGGPSTLSLTEKAEACLRQRLQDEKEKAQA